MIAGPNSRSRRICGLAAAGVCGFCGLFLDLQGAPAAPTATAPVPEAHYRAPTDPAELLRVDDEIRGYFGPRLAHAVTDSERLRRLIDAMLEPDGLHFMYAAGDTADARETFRRRRGNCVSYAFLIAAVAREFGFDARFQLVDRDTRWERFGDVVIAARHLDVLVTLNDGAYVIDPEPNVAAGNQYAMRVITDATAFSQFYSNSGVEHLVGGRITEAERYLALATRIAPRNAAAWANLGTLEARLGRLLAAKADFERSLELDRRGETAIDGYVSVLRRLGTADDLRRADKLERRVRAVRARNPYYQQAVATLAEQRGDLAAAEKSIRRAIRLKDDEPAFHAQWISILRRQGRTAEAQRAVHRLEQLRAQLPGAPQPLLH